MLDFLMENWRPLAETAGLVVLGASIALAAVAKWTKTKVDDTLAAKARAAALWVLSKLAINVKL